MRGRQRERRRVRRRPRSTRRSGTRSSATTPARTRSRAASCTPTTKQRRHLHDAERAPPSGPFFLQSADHAGADWVIETKVDAGDLSEGYEQAGLLARVDDDNYVKFDILADAGSATLNRIELRSEVGGGHPEPATAAHAAPGERRDYVWLRLTKTGTDYKGEYSFDGTTFHSTRRDPRAERDGEPGVRPVHARGQQRRRHRPLRLPRRGRRPRRLRGAAAGEPDAADPDRLGEPDDRLRAAAGAFTAAATIRTRATPCYSWDFGDGRRRRPSRTRPTRT